MDLIGTGIYFFVGGLITFGILNYILEDPDLSKILTAVILIVGYLYLQHKARREKEEVDRRERERKLEIANRERVSEMPKPTPRDEWGEQLFLWITDLELIVRAAPTGERGDLMVKKLLDLRMSMVKRLRALGGEWADRLR